MSSNSLSSLKDAAQDKLDRYTSTALGYAFNTYDHQGDLDAPLTASDVLMANLLNLGMKTSSIIPLFQDGKGPAQQLRVALDHALVELRDAAPFETYDELPLLERVVESLVLANEATKYVEGWTAVGVSKVLHRRRPHIVPIIDSRVRTFYGVSQPEYVRRALWEDIRENADWLSELAATKITLDGRALSLLRVADILIWTPE